MELVKERWTKSEILDFKNYEKTLVDSEKDTYFEQKIVNTKLKCFGRTSTKAREIAKQIRKGNYQEFLDSNSIDNHLDSLIAAHLISSIKDYDIFEKYIKSFVLTIDNWASVDTLKFKKVDKKQYTYNLKKSLKNLQKQQKKQKTSLKSENNNQSTFDDYTTDAPELKNYPKLNFPKPQ